LDRLGRFADLQFGIDGSGFAVLQVDVIDRHGLEPGLSEPDGVTAHWQGGDFV
jgi:hypothetical protein